MVPIVARARRLIFPAALLLWAGAAWALQSSSVNFSNARSAENSGGLRKNSASFRIDGAVGGQAQTSENSASYHGRDGLIPGYYYPAPATVTISTVYANGRVSLEWVSPGNDGNEHSIPGGYIVRYSSVASQAPTLSDALFDAATNVSPAPPAAVVQGMTVGMTVTGLTPGVRYYFAVRTYERDGTRSELSRTIQNLDLPQAPYGIGLNVGSSSVTLRWMPVVRYNDEVPFVVPSAAAPNELNGYHVFRATAPVRAPWTDVADLSSATLTWSDLTGDPQCAFQCYYYVAGSNTLGYSAASVVRSAADRSAYVVALDGVSFFQIPSANVAPIEGTVGDPNSAYLVMASNRPQDLEGLDGIVVKSVEFDAYLGGILLAPNWPMPGPGILHMSYQTAPASGLLTPSAMTAMTAAPSAMTATPANLSVYWNNGSSWVQLYGTLDSVDRTMTLQTKFVGRYQLRNVARAGSFSFSMAGVSNRFLTPNGDHKNDNVVFNFDNPQRSAVFCKIFDVKGRLVASNLPAGPQPDNSLMWDGTSKGRAVPGGVYIYEIRSEGQTHTGTLVVIR